MTLLFLWVPFHLELEWPENVIEASSGHERSFRMDSRLADGQVAFDELTGKSLSRVRYCPEGPYGDLFERTGHFCEFQFTDGSIFRIDSDTEFLPSAHPRR
jgi:hypothetical protein